MYLDTENLNLSSNVFCFQNLRKLTFYCALDCIKPIMAQSIRRVPSPPPTPPGRCICVIFSVPAVGYCQKTSAQGWGICQFFYKWLTLFLFLHFTYCAFQKHANSEAEKLPSQLHFLLLSIIIMITSNKPCSLRKHPFLLALQKSKTCGCQL